VVENDINFNVDEETSTSVETDVGHLTDSVKGIFNKKGGPRYEQILRIDQIIEL
jgi:hypothetical protein